MINYLRKAEKGFTLIELMICISIIGILAAIAIPNYLSYRSKAQDASAKSEARNYITTALAEIADTGADTTFGALNLPDGFTANADITMGGIDSIITSAGAITGGQTFIHKNGSTTYTVMADGSISSS